MEEFDKVQKQQGIAELITRALRKEGHEVPTPREPLTCWKCSETGHKKKDCVKLLFCVNCGQEGHVAS